LGVEAVAGEESPRGGWISEPVRVRAIEDARGVLPTNIHTNIVAKFDLRTLADTMRKRASTRTQGEYRDVMDGMKDAVLKGSQ
jgi:thymidylate synthase ThyX